ncbi:helix-turn-helix domain-containing protein [Paraclostridium sordellii]|uniref:helix-turn-helix domain-containing protein n=1 Tax=Paraclostridium sordellii TaxID=1505 RepID=UPI0005E2FFB1|nr:helix-turn-helix domain-containing protein [Paeniclostridium sordellii]CEQ14817.1 helix-turn-helix domain-containing protein [[Clostridium] sordellii] [Paeniclostridium sordellii]
MVQINEIKGRMKAEGYTQAELAKKLGISAKTLSTRLKKGVFGSDEIEKMITILKIENPIEIFFKN